MSAYDYKYTDRDVRENAALRSIAIDYLTGYGGDFDFLLQARQYLLVQGTLPTGMARGVLNCMRIDPKWAGTLPAPMARALLSQTLQSLIQPESTRRLYVVNPNRPRRIELKTTFNKPYVMSPWKTAYLVHLLDQRDSRLWYHPHTGTYECLLQGWCNISYGQRRNLIMVDHIPEGRRECNRCRIALENVRDDSPYSRRPRWP
jgi:hypothetical protein